MQQQYDRWQALNAEALAISTRPMAEVQAVQQALSLPYPMLSDADHAVALRYGVYDVARAELVPGIFVVSRHGTVIHRQLGYATPDSNSLEEARRALEGAEQAH